jgi:UDP-glucose 4-epimerase
MTELFDEYKGSSVLITGGLGFIGSNLARRLTEISGVKVFIVDALLPGQGGNPHNIHDIRDQVTVYNANLSSDWVINHIVVGMDYIFNLAGSVSHLDSMLDPLMDMELNCASQIRLLEACRSFNPRARIVFTSTRQVYGKPMYLPVDEQHPIAPLDMNGIHKRAAEMYHLLYHRVYNIPVVCLRLTNTYGPRQLVQHDRQGFIGWFIRQAMDGGVIEVFGDGKQERELIYVDDVVDALLLAGASKESEGEVFNLGGDHPISLADLAGELIQLTGRGTIRMKSFPRERKLIDLGSFYASYEKIEAAVGWRPKTPLGEGLRRTIEFYTKNREHYWNPIPAVVSQPEAMSEAQSYQIATPASVSS